MSKKPIKKAWRVGRNKTRKNAAAVALSEDAHRRQLDILSLFGTIDYDPNYDYKAERRVKR